MNKAAAFENYLNPFGLEGVDDSSSPSPTDLEKVHLALLRPYVEKTRERYLELLDRAISVKNGRLTHAYYDMNPLEMKMLLQLLEYNGFLAISDQQSTHQRAYWLFTIDLLNDGFNWLDKDWYAE